MPGASVSPTFTAFFPLLIVDALSRIALVNNALSSIPMSFARLSRLRYLTFRANSFSVFPEVASLFDMLFYGNTG